MRSASRCRRRRSRASAPPGGFTFRLQDRGGLGEAALSQARDQLLGLAAQSQIVTGVRFEGMPDAAQVSVAIDREKANTFGVTFADINSTISTNLGSSYVNDFPNAGRMQRVTVQADEGQRMQTADLLNLNVRNANGGMVPLSAFATVEWVQGLDPDDRLQRLPVGTHQRRSGSGLFFR